MNAGRVAESAPVAGKVASGIHPAALALLLVALAGCVTPLTPGALLGRLSDATAVRPYPFTALGTVTYTTPGNGGTGNVALAVEGVKFRLEVTDPMGATRLAVAGDGGRLIRLDPATGARRETRLGPEGTVPLGEGGAALPTALLGTAVTAALPPTGPLTAAFPSGRLACFASIEPTLTFCVGDDGLAEVWFPGDREQRVILTLGPESDAVPLHRRWAKMSDPQQGISVEIRWRSVTASPRHPAGFFSFDEEGEG
ncbi:MAG: hypothetical protein HQK87_10570 [Nitrospinae bacterium]|nr:hypothetical protein [Nitrospinota bacterium]